MAVTPVIGNTYVVTTGGTSVVPVPANPNGGIITNPLLATDQGLANAEPLIVNPIGTAGTHEGGSNFALQPGQSWQIIPGQTTPTSVNALSSGHTFSVIYW